MLFNILAAFGAGALASCIGAVPAFVMTGLITIVGAMAGMAGFDTIAFGTVFGPHIAFAGAVAATAYAAKKGYGVEGAAVGTPLAPLGKPDVIVVGGLFGVIGWAIATFIIGNIFGPILPGTDTPGMTVVISGIIARLAFGKRGLASGTKGAVTSAQSMLIAVAFSLMVAGTGLALNAVNPDIIGSYNLIIFGIAAFTLIFPGTPGWHQIGIISAYAVMIAIGAGMTGFAVVAFAVVAGVAAAFLCDLEGYLINTDVDSHIDGPGFAICLMTIVLNVVSGLL